MSLCACFGNLFEASEGTENRVLLAVEVHGVSLLRSSAIFVCFAT